MRSQTSKEMLYGLEPTWRIEKEEFGLESVKLSVQVDWQPQPCPCSGRVPHKHGESMHCYRGAPIHERQVLIAVRNPKYRCPRCKTMQSPELPAGKFTPECRRIIGLSALKNSITTISEQFDIERTTVARIVREEFQLMMDARVVPPPVILGIDNSQLSGKQRTVVVDLLRGTHLDVFGNIKGDVVVEGLRQYEEEWGETLQAIVIDQSDAFRSAVRSVFPHVPLLLDRFHVAMSLNHAFSEAVDAYREEQAAENSKGKLPPRSKELRMTAPAKVEAAYLALRDEWPELAKSLLHARCWQLMYQEATEAKAREYWVEWAAKLPEILKPHMGPVVDVITRRWLSELCAPIRFRDADGNIPTNGITEALNMRARRIDMRSNTGFDLSRKALLLAMGQRDRQKQVKARRKCLDEELRELGRVALRLHPK